MGFRYKLRNTAYFTHVTQHVLNTDLVQRIDCHILRQKCQKNYFSWIYQRFQVAVKSLLCEDQLKTSMKTLSSFFSRKQRAFCASGLNTYTNSFTYSFRAKPFNIRLETGLEKLVHATDSASILHVRLDPQHRLFYLVTQCKSFDELPFKLAQKQKKTRKSDVTQWEITRGAPDASVSTPTLCSLLWMSSKSKFWCSQHYEHTWSMLSVKVVNYRVGVK